MAVNTSCHCECHLTACRTLKLAYKWWPGWDVFIGSRFLFFFCGLEEKTERPGKRNQRVSISQGPEKPQGTQTAPHRLLTIHTPPFCLLHKRLRSVAGTDGDVSLGSFVVAIKGIPFPLSQRQPQNILRRESYILKQTQRARQKKRGGQIVAIVRSQKYFFPLA